jgi:RNA polymerase sigma-70 factor (ECF subfamily)
MVKFAFSPLLWRTAGVSRLTLALRLLGDRREPPFFLLTFQLSELLPYYAGGSSQPCGIGGGGASQRKVESAVSSGQADAPAGPEEGGRVVPSDQFVMWITSAQRPLYAYIRTLLGPCPDVEDVLQEVNLVLWRKAQEYDGPGQFLTWACHVAYLQVLAHLKRCRRDKHVYFDEGVLADLAAPLTHQVQSLEERLEALRHCLGHLPPEHRRMITVRYETGGSVQKIAQELRRPAGSVRVALHRIRSLLLECMQRRLAVEGSS